MLDLFWNSIIKHIELSHISIEEQLWGLLGKSSVSMEKWYNLELVIRNIVLLK